MRHTRKFTRNFSLPANMNMNVAFGRQIQVLKRKNKTRKTTTTNKSVFKDVLIYLTEIERDVAKPFAKTFHER